MEENFLLEIIGILIAFGIGLGCGSYSTMPYYRLPTGEACAGRWFGKRSHCTSCGHKLRTQDLVPVFNWLLTHGKCQFCGAKINGTYFFIEFTITIMSVLIYLKLGHQQLHYYVMLQGLACCLVILTATDYTFRIMPTPLFVVAILFGFLYHTPDDLFDMVYRFSLAALGGLAFVDLYGSVTKKTIEDYKYLKLIAIAGIWMDYLPFFVFLTITITGIILLTTIYNALGRKQPYFLAPAITLPFMALVLYPEYLAFLHFEGF